MRRSSQATSLGRPRVCPRRAADRACRARQLEAAVDGHVRGAPLGVERHAVAGFVQQSDGVGGVGARAAPGIAERHRRLARQCAIQRTPPWSSAAAPRRGFGPACDASACGSRTTCRRSAISRMASASTYSWRANAAASPRCAVKSASSTRADSVERQLVVQQSLDRALVGVLPPIGAEDVGAARVPGAAAWRACSFRPAPRGRTPRRRAAPAGSASCARRAPAAPDRTSPAPGRTCPSGRAAEGWDRPWRSDRRSRRRTSGARRSRAGAPRPDTAASISASPTSVKRDCSQSSCCSNTSGGSARISGKPVAAVSRT